MLPNPEDTCRFSFTPFGRDLRSYEGKEYAKILLNIYSGTGKAQWLMTSKWITYSENYVFVQSLSWVQLCDPRDWIMPGFLSFTISWSCSNSCPLSWWYHPTISSSVVPFSSCLQSFPASGSFLMSQLFASGGQSIGVSASASVSEYSGLISFRMDWLDLLAVQRTLKSLLRHHSSKASILWHSAFFTVQLSHLYMTTGKTIALTRRNFVGKVMSLLLNMLIYVGHNLPSKE